MAAVGGERERAGRKMPGGRGGRPHPSEKKFLRTLVVVDVPVPDKDGNDSGDDGGGDVGSGNSSNRNGTKKDLPSLYDAWLPAGKAQAVVEEEENHGIMPGGRTVHLGV